LAKENKVLKSHPLTACNLSFYGFKSITLTTQQSYHFSAYRPAYFGEREPLKICYFEEEDQQLVFCAEISNSMSAEN